MKYVLISDHIQYSAEFGEDNLFNPIYCVQGARPYLTLLRIKRTIVHMLTNMQTIVNMLTESLQCTHYCCPNINLMVYRSIPCKKLALIDPHITPYVNFC